jgi:murein DD-endopeptidase MepM/ murein hydrolase activator NlpD
MFQPLQPGSFLKHILIDYWIITLGIKFHSSTSKIFVIILLVCSFFSTSQSVKAQDQSGPVYVVQSGDTLYEIALKFGVTVSDLITSNQIANPDSLSAGMELVIPGLKGIQGKLVTEPIPLGQDMYSLSRYNGISQDMLIRLNHLTSPSEIFAGSNIIIPQSDTKVFRKSIPQLESGQSFLDLAASQNLNPWDFAQVNLLTHPNDLIPGEIVFTSTSEEAPPPNPLSPYVTSLDLSPLPLVQGSTIVIKVTTVEPATLSGSLNGMNLNFFSTGQNNEYAAIQGIYALADPGLAPFSLKVTLPNQQSYEFDQMMLLQQGYYPKDPPLSVDPETIDPANTKPEDDLVKNTTAPATPQKLWTNKFRVPLDEPICVKSGYGNRRSYNGGPFIYFHTGLDLGVCANLNIYADAPGTVVFDGPLTVRGLATIIDHGWGIYTAYYHQKESSVKVGDHVEAGQMVGQIGASGRVTGPHLHWEIWVNGIQVNPQEWLDRSMP